MDLILSIAFWTASLAELILSVIAERIASNTLRAVDFAAFSVFEIVDLILSNAEETVDFALFTAFVMVDFMLSQTLETVL